MSESLRMWVEILFNVGYLITITVLVIAMARRQPQVADADQPMTRLFIWAFALLGLGDLGHVGFRVIAYALAGPEIDSAGITVKLLGREVGLIGLGALSTATTVTFFYALMLVVWHRRFSKPYSVFGTLLFVAGVVRLVIMAFPQNEWNRTVPPWGWSMARNLPLMVQGLGLVVLILRDAAEQHDRTFKAIGWMIIASYAFYTPVILFVQQVPLLGMLMIPKTVAYVAIAWIGYRSFFETARATQPAPAV